MPRRLARRGFDLEFQRAQRESHEHSPHQRAKAQAMSLWSLCGALPRAPMLGGTLHSN